MSMAYLIIAASLVAAVYFGIRYFVRASQKFAGEQIIICPETEKQAMVEVDVICRFAGTATLRKHSGANVLIWSCNGRLLVASYWAVESGGAENLAFLLNG